MGSKKNPFFRIVAADSRFPRDGRFIEMLGFYDPMTEPANIKIDEDKLYKWLDDGAKPTDNTADVLKKAGLLERWQLLKSGVKISELDEVIEARREKQPKPEGKKVEKLSKKAVAAAQKAQEDKDKAEEEAAKKAEEAVPDSEKAAEETPAENEAGETPKE